MRLPTAMTGRRFDGMIAFSVVTDRSPCACLFHDGQRPIPGRAGHLVMTKCGSAGERRIPE